MELKHLRSFLAVAREGSITHAANYLHISQPALSRQMQDLEDELQVRLFERGSHQVTLTPDGMSFRQRAREIVDLSDQVLEEFQTLKDSISGEIRIGCGESRNMMWLIEMLRNLQIDYPDLRFSIYSGNSEDVIDRLEKGLLDFGVLVEPVTLKHCDSIRFPKRDIWGVLMRKDSPFASSPTITLDQLRQMNLLCSLQMIPGKIKHNGFAQWFENREDELQIVGTYNLIYNAGLMVENAIGNALTLEGLANTSEQSPLCFRRLEPELSSGLLLVWKKYRILSPAAQLLLDSVQNQQKEESV